MVEDDYTNEADEAIETPHQEARPDEHSPLLFSGVEVSPQQEDTVGIGTVSSVRGTSGHTAHRTIKKWVRKKNS